MNELEQIIAELKKSLSDTRASALLERKSAAQANAKAKEFEALYIREHELKHKIDRDWQLKFQRTETLVYILEEFIAEKNLQSELKVFIDKHPDRNMI